MANVMSVERLEPFICACGDASLLNRKIPQTATRTLVAGGIRMIHARSISQRQYLIVVTNWQQRLVSRGALQPTAQISLST